jgi:dethiobiotin synthetase
VHRYFVTGTDTDVGKTRVTAALALALREAGESPTIVKVVQTGLARGPDGDAVRAGALAGVHSVELVRLEKAADPWSAAREQGTALRAAELVAALDALEGPLAVEGTGGMMVPLNDREHLGNVVASAKLEAIVVVGLRLGCLNHTLLTLNLCRELRVPIAGAVLVERWGATDPAYREDVTSVLQGKVRILGILPFAPTEAESVQAGAKLLRSLVNRDR